MAVPRENVTPVQTNFTGGEYSPEMRGRVDISKYYNGCETVENFMVWPLGYVSRRMGSKYVAEVKNSANDVWLFPFEVSVPQAYVIESGAGYFRFFKDKGTIVIETHSDTITNGTFDSGITGWTDVSSGSGSIAHDAVELRLQITESSGAGAAEQSVAIGDPTQKTAIKFAVFDNSVKLRIGSSSGATDIINDLVFEPGYHIYSFTPGGGNDPIYVRFINDNTGTTSEIDNVSLVSGPAELETPYTGTAYKEFEFAQSQDIMYFAHKDHPPYKMSRFDHDAWSLEIADLTGDPFTSTDNYPRAVTFYESRLWFGGTNNHPQRVWGSKNTDIDDFTVGTNPEDAVDFTIASKDSNTILWLSPTTVLVAGTSGGNFVIRANNQSDAITPTDVKATKETSTKASEVTPLRVGNRVIFVQRQGHTLHEMGYEFESDSFVDPDLNLLAEHMARTVAYTQIDYQQSRNKVIWAITDDGQLQALTYLRSQEVVAWQRHPLGGTGAEVESIAIIPGTNQDEVWMSVKRTINGGTKRYIEYIEDEFYPTTAVAQEDAFYVDCGLSYDSTPATVFTNLDHLEGETVTILADGATHPTKVVASGSITLDRSASVVHVGLGYSSKLKTMPYEEGSAGPGLVGVTKNINKVGITFQDTLGAEYGYDSTKLDTLQFRAASDPMDAPPPLFTGIKMVDFPSNWDRDGQIIVEQNQPLPCKIISLALFAATGSI